MNKICQIAMVGCLYLIFLGAESQCLALKVRNVPLAELVKTADLIVQGNPSNLKTKIDKRFGYDRWQASVNVTKVLKGRIETTSVHVAWNNFSGGNTNKYQSSREMVWILFKQKGQGRATWHSTHNGVVSTNKTPAIMKFVESSSSSKSVALAAKQKIAWGAEVAGLRAGIEIIDADLSTNGSIVIVCHIKNVTSDDSPMLKDTAFQHLWNVVFSNAKKESFYGGMKMDAVGKFLSKTYELDPDEERVFRRKLTSNEWTFSRFDGGSRKRFSVLPPGDYSVSAVYRGYYVDSRSTPIETGAIELPSASGKKGKNLAEKPAGDATH